MVPDFRIGSFEWDKEKDALNQIAHGMSFIQAVQVFDDPFRKISFDEAHSQSEQRWYCVGRIGEKIVTVRFVYRESRIRIFGAGAWRSGRKLYEKKT